LNNFNNLWLWLGADRPYFLPLKNLKHFDIDKLLWPWGGGLAEWSSQSEKKEKFLPVKIFSGQKFLSLKMNLTDLSLTAGNSAFI
jgi:hypothetical protein